MSIHSEFSAYILEVLEDLEDISAARFFGGVSMSSGAQQFAMIMGDTLYLCVDDSTRPRYLEMGCECFAYDSKRGRVQVKKYYAVPDELLDAPEELRDWAQDAIDAARRSRP